MPQVPLINHQKVLNIYLNRSIWGAWVDAWVANLVKRRLLVSAQVVTLWLWG